MLGFFPRNAYPHTPLGYHGAVCQTADVDAIFRNSQNFSACLSKMHQRSSISPTPQTGQIAGFLRLLSIIMPPHRQIVLWWALSQKARKNRQKARNRPKIRSYHNSFGQQVALPDSVGWFGPAD
jgi:hypothetical protein